jgi:hypothetical protein
MPIAVCVSPSFSFSSTAGQRRWDFRSDFHRLTAIVISARRIGKSINWRKLCVEDQIDCRRKKEHWFQNLLARHYRK